MIASISADEGETPLYIWNCCEERQELKMTYTIIKAEVQRRISWYVTGTRRLLYIR